MYGLVRLNHAEDDEGGRFWWHKGRAKRRNQSFECVLLSTSVRVLVLTFVRSCSLNYLSCWVDSFVFLLGPSSMNRSRSIF